MLNQLDLGRIAKQLRANGYQRFEIYGEVSQCTTIKLHDRSDETSLRHDGGISIRAHSSSNASIHTFNTSDFSTAGVMRSLGSDKLADQTRRKRSAGPIIQHPEKFGQLSEFYRSLLPGSSVLPLVTFEEENKQFEVFSSEDAAPCRGQDQRAQLLIQWYSPKENRLYKVPWHRRTVLGLLDDLKNETALRQRFCHTIQSPVRWPLPSGDIDTVWSSLAFSKALLPIIRLCEADRGSGAQRFWENTGALPDWFSLSDFPEATASCDFQGTPRIPTPLVKNGELSALACDRSLAEEIHCTPTGHGRRETFSSPVGVGLWNAEIHGPQTAGDLIGALGNGIYIADIDVLDWNPTAGNAQIFLRHGRLVHHGELGEWLEPTTIEVSLPRLLHSCAALGQNARSRGFRISKPQGRHITEIASPDALTAALPYAGQVPAAHYW